MTNEKNENNIEETQTVSEVAPKTKATSKVSGHDDFDWEADDAGFQSYSKEERNNLEESYSKTFSPVV